MPTVETDGRRPPGSESGSFDPPDEQTDRIDDIFEILRNSRRRYILRYLVDNGGQADFRDLVEVVTAWEEGIPVEQITYDQRKRVYIALHQTHVPKLDALDVVDYDSHSGSVTLTEKIESLEPFLHLADATGPSSTDTGDAENRDTDDVDDRSESGTAPRDEVAALVRDPMVGIGVGGLAAAILAVAGVPPFGWIPGIAYTVVLFVIVLVASFARSSANGDPARE